MRTLAEYIKYSKFSAPSLSARAFWEQGTGEAIFVAHVIFTIPNQHGLDLSPNGTNKLTDVQQIFRNEPIPPCRLDSETEEGMIKITASEPWFIKKIMTILELELPSKVKGFHMGKGKLVDISPEKLLTTPE